MENINGPTNETGPQPSKLEHLRGILSKLQQAMENRRDERLGRKAPVQVVTNIAFPKPATTTTGSGKPRATPKSLSDFEAAFARLTSRQAS
ncbi:MAG: hypothetical protein K8R92_06240 [Planctomycetes bacterium]|nr:hypothetical protein [Planctomycetota bacterium]